MGIRRLIQQVSEDIVLEISDKRALITFECDGLQECLYLVDTSVDELRKLERFKSPTNIKFIGSRYMLIGIEQMRLGWEPFEKEVIIGQPVEAVYYSETGQVRVGKTEIQDKPEVLLKTKKKVLIIDDSKTIQKLLTRIIDESNDLICMGVADDPLKAKDMIEKDRPDLITLDMHMPHMTGLEFLKSYLGVKNIPTVMITSLGIDEGTEVVEALSCGADCYIQKPAADKIGSEKADMLAVLESVANSKGTKSTMRNISKGSTFHSFDGLIAIGSSTGGTKALEQIFVSLPDEIPPIVVVQHIPAVFSKALAERLNQLCEFRVKEAEEGEILSKNTIYIAPGDLHMRIIKRGNEKRVSLSDEAPINRFRPSVDYLFSNLNVFKDINMVGVILTGMGRDGAKGLLDLKNQGAFTIAQDEESSVVFGMPKEAIALGAHNEIVGLDHMACAIVVAFNKKSKNF